MAGEASLPDGAVAWGAAAAAAAGGERRKGGTRVGEACHEAGRADPGRLDRALLAVLRCATSRRLDRALL